MTKEDKKIKEAVLAERKRILESFKEIKKRKYKIGHRPWCIECLNRIRKEVIKIINL